MKTKGFLLTLGWTVLTLSTFSQKVSQADLPNEFYAGYGLGSVFYFSGLSNHYYSDAYPYKADQYLRSAGTFLLGYTRHLNRVVSVGSQFAYFPATTDLTYNDYSEGTGTNDVIHRTAHDNVLMALTRITFSYVSKSFFRIYSGFAIGVTVDLGNVTYNGTTENKRKLLPAGQLTMFGVRFGRSLGGFLEMGIGTLGIVTAGISYKIKD
ncbi:MAG TPA: hypothetical protein VMC08_05360 [Bacteroidales bacterium]|nr:hypothetical protein [Bacteroidales bacterium]